MAVLDYAIIVVYISAMVIIGLIFQRRASKGIDSYFLGEKKLPWWALGASGMASNLDVSGTMINTAFIYALGASGFFIEIRGGIVLIMAFFMVFLGKWNRRSKAMTLAEWMRLRFGDTFEGRIARLISALAILLTTVAIVSYFAVGGGKFIAEFLGIPSLFGLSSQFVASFIMIALAMIYTVASGLQGVVWTDVFQGVLIFITIVIICIIAMSQFKLPEEFAISIPLLEGGFKEIETTKDVWTRVIPEWKMDLPENSTYSIYNLFGITILFYLLKTIIEGSGGTGGYMTQRFFAAKNDKEAGLLSMFWIFLLSFRWPFVMAIAIMAISYGAGGGEVIQDPEMVLPIVINKLIPIGLKGLLVAGLMAAAMSTFDSLVNSGASYWVKDVYQTFINPNATDKQLMLQSRWSSIVIVAMGLMLTFSMESINEVWGWITMSINVGLIIPLLIRWYWWRLNGYGFAAGIVAGMMMALVQKFVFPDIAEYYAFLMVSGTSLVGTIIGTLVTKPTDMNILINFYNITKPFGFWKTVQKNIDGTSNKRIKKENKNDIIAIMFAVPWQLVLFLTVMMVVAEDWNAVGWLFGLLVILSLGLYKFWFKNLSGDSA